MLTIGGQKGRLTDDGEFWTTETERENDVFVVYQEAAINATKYIALIDRDNVLFPHRIQGECCDRLDVTSIYYTMEFSANASIVLQYGVISRIDGVNGDVWYFTGIPALTGVNQEDRIISLRAVPSQVKLDCLNGVLQHGLTNIRETNVAALNTGVFLDSPAGAGTITPGVGDLILKVTVTAGSMNFATFVFYHSH